MKSNMRSYIGRRKPFVSASPYPSSSAVDNHTSDPVWNYWYNLYLCPINCQKLVVCLSYNVSSSDRFILPSRRALCKYHHSRFKFVRMNLWDIYLYANAKMLYFFHTKLQLIRNNLYRAPRQQDCFLGQIFFHRFEWSVFCISGVIYDEKIY